MREIRTVLAGLVAACVVGAATAAPLHRFLSVAIAPDGAHVASVEGDETPSGSVDIEALVIRPVAGGEAVTVALPCGAVPQCTPADPAWAPDARHVAFTLRTPGSHAHGIYSAGLDGAAPQKLAGFDGTLAGLRYGPGGRLAVLATAGAAKELGAVEAGAAITGELGGDVHEQRIALVQADGMLSWASPADLFVYEYDWMPDGRGFVGTAAHGDGDNNWWVAKLYAFDPAPAAAQVIYTPSSPRQQLAQPRVSRDGRSVSFIGGLMSDFGSTSGDAFILNFNSTSGKAPLNFTQDGRASVRSLAWSCDDFGLIATVQQAGQTRIDDFSFGIESLGPLDRAFPHPAIPLFVGDETLAAGNGAIATDCHTRMTATIHESFDHAPEIEVGRIGDWHDITHVNTAQTPPGAAQSITWTNDGFSEQGWLIRPKIPATAKLPLITVVHGGPGSAYGSFFMGGTMWSKLLDAGYALLLPNPRGSFGQGEAYTLANVGDLGHGDLRDIMAGIDAAERAAPIDEHRLGIAGWSYGGFMTMWAVTQTNRFRAAVAGAGISDWQSYYGQNGIDAWMIPFFGASVYDDPKIYERSSPIAFIRNVRTPTLAVVGERDIECPAPQTQEFWHALHDLGVPTQSVIYPGEGHRVHDPAHVADIERRMVGWFDRYLKK